VRELVEYDEYTGRFAALNRVEVRSRVSGYLSGTDFVEGDLVGKGDRLFIIDQRPFQLAVRSAEAEVAEARANLDLASIEAERARNLAGDQAISQEDRDRRIQQEVAARARLARAEATLARARLDLEFTEIRAPLAGRVGRRRVDVGNLVTGGDVQGTVLTTINQIDPIHFSFDISEADFLRYTRLSERGERPSSRTTPNAVSIRLLDEQEFQHHGVVDFVDNELDATSGTLEARAVLSNPDGFLLPGVFGRLRLLGSGLYEAVLVPDRVIQFDQSRKFVFTVDGEGTVGRRFVETGPMVDGLRIIREGLSGDDRVIADAFHRVRVGATVKTVEQPVDAGSAD
jgi:RND family efflux transporter MFP subunit